MKAWTGWVVLVVVLVGVVAFVLTRPSDQERCGSQPNQRWEAVGIGRQHTGEQQYEMACIRTDLP